MDATFHALGRILLNAVPTFLILLCLVAYLRWAFYGPLAKVLRKRDDETNGARKAAEASMRLAEQKIEEYEEKLRAARLEMYAEQERVLRRVQEENDKLIAIARREADANLSQAKAELTGDAEKARLSLEQQTEKLADLIATHILEGRAA